MLTIEELNHMDDISGPVLYSAELRRLPFLTPKAEAQHITKAQAGNDESRSALLSHCLPWLMAKAVAVYAERRPSHSDVMDLVGQANLEMVEALPNALQADNPVRYLMSVGVLAMKRYSFYNDPMIRRPRRRPDDYEHPTMASLEAGEWPLLENIAMPDISLTREETEEWKIREQDKIIYAALQQLSPHYRDTLVAYYGLYGQPAKRAGDIAKELQKNKKAVEHTLRRAKDKVAANLTSFMK